MCTWWADGSGVEQPVCGFAGASAVTVGRHQADSFGCRAVESCGSYISLYSSELIVRGGPYRPHHGEIPRVAVVIGWAV